MVDRISSEPLAGSFDGVPLKDLPPARMIDRDAFLVSALDTPKVKRDKKRRRQIARKQMVEQGILPPSALNNTW